MKKDRKILTKSDGKKIITYPDGSWCDYNDLIDTTWTIKGNPSFVDGSITLLKDGVVDPHSIASIFGFNCDWSINGNAIELSFIDIEYEQEKILLTGEIVFEESSRFIVGDFYKSTFSAAHNKSPLTEFRGKFTATEVKLEISDD